MARKFHYSPPIVSNNILFVLLLGLFLLFMQFYGNVTWNWFMSKMSVLQFVIGIGFSFYFIVFWALGIPYIYLTMSGKFPSLQKYKIQDSHPGRNGPKVPLSKAIKLVLFNQFAGTLPFLVLLYYLVAHFGYAKLHPVEPWYVILLQLLAFLLVEDVLFFAVHWTMHKKWFFKKFHRVHHEYRESIAIATHYVHYVEHIFGNLIPVFAGIIILQPHPFTILFWILVVVMNALHTHSGYAFPWMSYSVHHDWHHYHINGSFSAVGLMDKVFGTDKALEKLHKEHQSQK